MFFPTIIYSYIIFNFDVLHNILFLPAILNLRKPYWPESAVQWWKFCRLVFSLTRRFSFPLMYDSTSMMQTLTAAVLYRFNKKISKKRSCSLCHIIILWWIGRVQWSSASKSNSDNTGMRANEISRWLIDSIHSFDSLDSYVLLHLFWGRTDEKVRFLPLYYILFIATQAPNASIKSSRITYY